MYQAPQASVAAPAQQYAPQAEVPYATDAYQAVMGSAPLMQVTLFSDMPAQVEHSLYTLVQHHRNWDTTAETLADRNSNIKIIIACAHCRVRRAPRRSRR